MLLQLINNNAFDRLAGALCNTLMHSLWQGILLTAIAGLIIICTRKTSSALRYNLLISAMMLFAIGVSVTFIWQYSRSNPMLAIKTPSGIRINNTVQQVQSAHVYLGGQDLSQQPFTVSVNNFLSEHHNIIVFIWFLIVCARCLQLAFGLYGIYRLRRVQVTIVKGDWQQRLQLLANKLRLIKAVILLESGLAKVPMVIGYLKPVILVPVGLLNTLSAEEVEAILIHELAHIKRRDYLVNMLQSLMEIVFFFNPAVLWVSKLIKTERENCCDDLAVSQNNNKINYIRALVSCEEYQASVPAYAMGLPGSKNTLLNRVKRIVSNRNYSLNLFEKTILAVCLVILGLGVSAFTAREHIQKAMKSVVAVLHHDVKPEHSFKTVVNDTTHKKQILTDKTDESPNHAHLLPQDTIITTGSPALDALVGTVDNLKGKDEFSSPKILLLNSDSTPLQTLSLKNNGSSDIVHEIARELYHENLLTDTDHVSITLNEHELIVNGVRMPEEVHERIYKQFGNGTNYEGSYNDPYVHRYPDSYSSNSYNNSSTLYQHQSEDQQKYWAAQQRKIIDEMTREGLINDRKDLSFTLTDKTFVINGLVQSDEVFQRYHQEYQPVHTGDNWSWGYVNNNPGNNSTDTNGSRDWDAYSRQSAADRQRMETERDKKLVADLLQDGLITDPNNVTFKLTGRDLTINGKKQSAEIYQKYKEKYEPNAGNGSSWTYSHHE